MTVFLIIICGYNLNPSNAKINLVMDRGFCSEHNINELYRQHHKFLMAAKASLKFIQQKLGEIRDGFDSRVHYNS